MEKFKNYLDKLITARYYIIVDSKQHTQKERIMYSKFNENYLRFKKIFKSHKIAYRLAVITTL